MVLIHLTADYNRSRKQITIQKLSQLPLNAAMTACKCSRYTHV